MDDTLKKKWLEMAVREVSSQCQLANTAYQALSSANNTDAAFFGIQGFLTHCANVSKMLQAEQEPQPLSKLQYNWRAVFRFLQRTGIYKLAVTIGDMLGIARSSVVHQKGREFRNNLDHYDQRLFYWLKKHGPNINIGDFNVMPKSAIKLGTGVQFLYVRNLDPRTKVFTFVDKDLDLSVLHKECLKIQLIANNWLAS